MLSALVSGAIEVTNYNYTFYVNSLTDAKGMPQGHVYISCFREMDSHREFLKEITNLDHNRMRPISCTRRCRASLYTYAGLQVRLGEHDIAVYSSEFVELFNSY